MLFSVLGWWRRAPWRDAAAGRATCSRGELLRESDDPAHRHVPPFQWPREGADRTEWTRWESAEPRGNGQSLPSGGRSDRRPNEVAPPIPGHAAPNGNCRALAETAPPCWPARSRGTRCVPWPRACGNCRIPPATVPADPPSGRVRPADVLLRPAARRLRRPAARLHLPPNPVLRWGEALPA